MVSIGCDLRVLACGSITADGHKGDNLVVSRWKQYGRYSTSWDPIVWRPKQQLSCTCRCRRYNIQVVLWKYKELIRSYSAADRKLIQPMVWFWHQPMRPISRFEVISASRPIQSQPMQRLMTMRETIDLSAGGRWTANYTQQPMIKHSK